MLVLLVVNVLLFELLSTFQGTMAFKCPSLSRSPCKCKTKTEGLDITCRSATVEDIRRSLKGITQPISYLKLNNNNLATLPDSLFPDINVSHITMGRSNILKISTNAFLGLERKLKNLDLSTNHLTTIPTAALRNLRSLISLNLGFNQFSSIDDDAFVGLDSLENLYLYSNQIKYISSSAFSGLGMTLKFINLGGNRLTSVPESALKGLQVLRTLKLQENQIKDVDDDAFDGLEATLDSLDLDKNHFPRIPGAAISKLKMLKALSIRDNGIREVNREDFQGIEDTLEILELGQNQLIDIPIHALEIMTRLHTLGLQKNKITFVPNYAFRKMGNTLKYLHLEENLISDIGQYAFRGLTVIGWIHLSLNQISRLPLDAFTDLDKTLQLLDIRGNPLVCDCGLQWIKTWHINSKSVLLQSPQDTTCFEPETLSGTPILNVNYEEMHCEDETKMEKGEEEDPLPDPREGIDKDSELENIDIYGGNNHKSGKTTFATEESANVNKLDEINNSGDESKKSHFNATTSGVSGKTSRACTYLSFGILHIIFLITLSHVNYFLGIISTASCPW